MRNAWKSLSLILKTVLSRPVLSGEFRSGEILFANRNSVLEIFLSGVGVAYITISSTAGEARNTRRYLRTFRSLSPEIEKLTFHVSVGQEAWVGAISLGGFASKIFAEIPTASIRGKLAPNVHTIGLNAENNPNAALNASGVATLLKNPRLFRINNSHIDSFRRGEKKVSLTVAPVAVGIRPTILSTTRILCRAELPKMETRQLNAAVLRPNYRIASILMD